MAKVYKVHPALGIARVGKGDGFFIQAERSEAGPFELDADGVTIAFTGYKDGTHRIRRQGCRFRVFEYERAPSGDAFIGEVDTDQVTIQWHVRLGNRKAAGHFMTPGQGLDPQTPERVIVPSPGFRNAPPAGLQREDLAATVEFTLSGRGAATGPQSGRIAGRNVILGEGRTDDAGRLVVLGGDGSADSWLDQSSLTDYLNNPGWYDTTSDGSVDATLVFDDGTRVPVDEGGWVVVGPPDFAPDNRPVVSLWDIAFDAQARQGTLTVPAVSFADDIEPILARAAALYWTNERGPWEDLRDVLALPELRNPSQLEPIAKVRRETRKLLLSAQQSIADFRLTGTQRAQLNAWVQGEFVPGPDPARPALNAAQALDEAALRATIGSGFFPGIEGGFMFTYPSLYASLGRVTRGTFKDWDNQQRKLQPGSLTERMAVPWQADFMECEGAWWPAQRPDIARYAANGNEVRLEWHRGVISGSAATEQSHLNMVNKFDLLGVVQKVSIGGAEVYAEVGRDPNL